MKENNTVKKARCYTCGGTGTEIIETNQTSITRRCGTCGGSGSL